MDSERKSGWELVRELLMHEERKRIERLKAKYLQARLDRNLVYVLCGRLTCGTRLARLHRFELDDESREAMRGQVLADIDNPYEFNIIAFLPGWAPQKDRTWEKSRRAQQRESKGGTAVNRRYPERIAQIGINSVKNSDLISLPAIARCPNRDCGWINVLLSENVHAEQLTLIPQAGDELLRFDVG
jgi:hypothetical protein